MDEYGGVSMKTTASLGAYEAAPEVIERRLLTLAQSLDRYQVSAGHGGEHQMSFLAALSMLPGKIFLPYALDCIERGGFQGDFAVRS